MNELIYAEAKQANNKIGILKRIITEIQNLGNEKKKTNWETAKESIQ